MHKSVSKISFVLLSVLFCGCFSPTPEIPIGQLRGVLSNSDGDPLPGYGISILPGAPVGDDLFERVADLSGRQTVFYHECEGITLETFYEYTNSFGLFRIYDVQLVGVYTVIIKPPNREKVFDVFTKTIDPPGVFIAIELDSDTNIIIKESRQVRGYFFESTEWILP